MPAGKQRDMLRSIISVLGLLFFFISLTLLVSDTHSGLFRGLFAFSLFVNAFTIKIDQEVVATSDQSASETEQQQAA